jgi:hypothetical protein
MGLDAVVFCDCVEKGCLLVPHPYPRLLYIAGNGSPEIRSKDPAKIHEHDNWMDLPPCKHEGMMLAGCSVGNMMFVPHLRDILSDVATKRGLALCCWGKCFIAGPTAEIISRSGTSGGFQMSLIR